MSIKPPVVSIIVLVGNKNKYFSETINSILQQTFSDFEVLIFNCGNSQNLVKWFNRQSDPRLKLFLPTNLAPATVFNLGIKMSKGDYLTFLEVDNIWHPQKLEKQVFCFNCYPAVGLVHSWLMQIDNRSQSFGKVIKQHLSGWVESEILKRNQIDSETVMIRRCCFDKVGLFDPKLPTTLDWDMWIRLSRYYQFMTIAEPLVYYRQHQDRVRESWLAMEPDLQATIEKAYQNVPTKLLTLKDRSYAYASLGLAWQVLQNQNPDPSIADNYCRQALEHFPGIGFSQEFFLASLAVLARYFYQNLRHNHWLLVIENSGTWLTIIFHKFKISAVAFWIWMLEEEWMSKEE
ncbi:MAG: glycosyltransferase [Pleurocapsa sp. MO_226.B13]|nr:glycosyltransferase [Pleurocapsa sp. MO_226.B13]